MVDGCVWAHAVSSSRPRASARTHPNPLRNGCGFAGAGAARGGQLHIDVETICHRASRIGARCAACADAADNSSRVGCIASPPAACRAWEATEEAQTGRNGAVGGIERCAWEGSGVENAGHLPPSSPVDGLSAEGCDTAGQVRPRLHIHGVMRVRHHVHQRRQGHPALPRVPHRAGALSTALPSSSYATAAAAAAAAIVASGSLYPSSTDC